LGGPGEDRSVTSTGTVGNPLTGSSAAIHIGLSWPGLLLVSVVWLRLSAAAGPFALVAPLPHFEGSTRSPGVKGCARRRSPELVRP
jgi:hypothetical protein